MQPDEYRPCKLGTMPAFARVHRADKVEVGEQITIQERRGGKWQCVLVTYVDKETGYFIASR